MKKMLLAYLLFTGVTLGVTAQQKKEVSSKAVPQAVKIKLNAQFPNASDIDWKKTADHYIASFSSKGVDHYAKFSSQNIIVSWGKEIKQSEIPAAVVKAVRRDFANYKIDDAFKVIEGGNTNYKLSLDGSPDRKVMYAATGTMIKDKLDDDE